MTDPTKAQATDDRQVPEYDESPDEAQRAEHSRSEEGAIVSIADLVGAKVVTHDGEKRGTVTEVLLEPPPGLRISALVVGTSGWLHRLRIASLVRAALRQSPRIDEIPWAAVDRWDGLKVVLRPEAEHEGVEEAEE